MSFIAFHEECFGCLPSPPPFPLPPVRDWVGDLVERGVVSASNYVAALNKLQTGASAPSLRGDPHIARALKGWARTRPPVVKKNPMGCAMIASLAAEAHAAPLLHARNIAMLAVGCSGAMRGPSELLRARLPLESVPEGAQVRLHTKTDTRHVAQTSIRRIRPVAGDLRPLELVQTYLHLSGHTEGWLFRSISGGGKFAVSNKRPVSQTSLNELVKSSAKRLGFDPRAFGTHSLKHGFADDGKLAGVPNRVLKAAGGWKSDHAFHGYGGEAARQKARRLEREELAVQAKRDRDGLHDAVWAVGSAPPAASKTVSYPTIVGFASAGCLATGCEPVETRPPPPPPSPPMCWSSVARAGCRASGQGWGPFAILLPVTGV
jgi:integrase